MCSKDKKGILADYNGALPQTPGFNALRTQAWFVKKGAAHYTLAPCFSHQIDAQVASQPPTPLRGEMLSRNFIPILSFGCYKTLNGGSRRPISTWCLVPVSQPGLGTV